jgi:sortase A
LRDGYVRSNRRGVLLLKWLERLFVLVGGVALGWCSFILTEADVAQRLGRERLESIARESTTSSWAPAGTPSPVVPSVLSRPVRGTPLAELTIPRIALSAVVLQGSDDETLRLGLGHIENTPLPGESGNVAIAGHRDSFFRPLRDVHVGDDILLDIPEGRVRYRVSSLRIVSPSEISVIGPTNGAMLTLVTCYPFWFIGQAPDRFVVRATRAEDQAASVK